MKGGGERKEGMEEWAGRRTRASFFAGGEEFQGFLEVLDGRAHVLVLQGAAGVLAVFLGFGEVFRGELDAAWREGERNDRRIKDGGGQREGN